MDYDSLYLLEKPLGTFPYLQDSQIYYIYIIENNEQLLRDRQKRRMDEMAMAIKNKSKLKFEHEQEYGHDSYPDDPSLGVGLNPGSGGDDSHIHTNTHTSTRRLDDGRVFNTCTCIYGTACEVCVYEMCI